MFPDKAFKGMGCKSKISTKVGKFKIHETLSEFTGNFISIPNAFTTF